MVDAAVAEELAEARAPSVLHCCWDHFKGAKLHLEEATKASWEGVFHPPGCAPRRPEDVLDWALAVAPNVEAEFKQAASDYRSAQALLVQKATRLREAASHAAWLHVVKTRAAASNPSLM